MKITILSFIALTLLAPLAQADEFPNAPDGKPIVSTADEPIHHVILENRSVRVMRVMIMPGEQTMWHQQHLDYVNTHISGSPVKMEYVGGKPSTDGEMVTGTVTFGDFQAKNEIDRVTNTGKTLNHQVTFEIKHKGPQYSGDVDRSNVKGFQLVLDKPSVRGWRVVLAPGEGTGEYTQKHPGVRVIFAGNRLLSKPQGKQMALQTTVSPADAFLVDAETRTIFNGGNTNLEFYEFELR